MMASRESKLRAASSAVLIFPRCYDIALAEAALFRRRRCRVRKNLSIAALLFAWLCANGALLDFVQVFAWGKMFSENACTMSVTAALQATFDPAQACDICVSVAAAKDSTEKQSPASVERASAEKLLLALHAPARPFFISPAADWPETLASVAPSRTESVPVPPPRA